MLSGYEKSHEFVSREIFFLGAPNKTGSTAESMDMSLLALNYFSTDIITAVQAKSFLEQIAITYIISKVFNLGNCERQSFALFMHILNEGHFKESLEIILINGKSLLGPHRCVVADRDQKSNLNDLSAWQNATYIDTWSGEILSDKYLISLTKEQLAKKGGVSGNVELKCMYRRQEKLSKNECINLIDFLEKSKTKLTVSMLKLLKESYPNDLKNLLLNIDEQLLIDQIYAQISNDISIYKTIAFNLSSNNNTLEPTMLFPEISMGITMFSNSVSTLSNIVEEKLNIGNICLTFEKDEDSDFSLIITQDGVRKEGMFVSEKDACELINANKLGINHLISTLECWGATASKIARMLKTQESSVKNIFK